MRKSFTQLFSIFILSMVVSLQGIAGTNGITISPDADGYTNLKTTSKFVVTTDEQVVAGVGVVRLLDKSGTALKTYQATSANVAISSVKNNADMYEITIDFSTYLKEETLYSFEFDPDFVRAKDDGAASNATGPFLVTVGDYTSPKLVDTNFFDPETGETKDVQLDQYLSVTFDEDVQWADDGEIYIYTDNGTAYGDLFEIVTPVKSAALANFNVLRIYHQKDFEPETKYYVIIPEGAIVDNQINAASPFDEAEYDNQNPYAGWLAHDTWYFTTRDNTAPVFSDVIADNIGSSKFDVYFKLDEAGKANLLAVENEAAAPSYSDFTTANGAKTVEVTDASNPYSTTFTKYLGGTIAESRAYDVYAYAVNTQNPADTSTVKKILTKVKTTDVTAPVIDKLTAGSFVPEINSTVATKDADTLKFTMTAASFNGSIETLEAGAGNLELWKYDQSLNHVKMLSVAAGSSAVLYGKGTNKNQVWVLVDPSVYESEIKYFVRIPNGWVKDDSGNEVAGLLTNDDWMFLIVDFEAPTFVVTDNQTDLKQAVGGEFTVTVDFDEDVYTDAAHTTPLNVASCGNLILIQHYDGTNWGSVNVSSVDFDASADKFTFHVAHTDAESKGSYRVLVDGENIYDDAGNAAEDGEYLFTLKDFEAPEVVNWKTELQPSDNVVIEWDEKVYNEDASEITDADLKNIVIFRKGADQTGTIVSASYSVSADGKSFIIDPVNNMGPEGQVYYVKVGAATLADADRNRNLVWDGNFTIGDITPPTAKLYSDGTEVDGTELVDPNIDMRIVFSEPVVRKDGGSNNSGSMASDLITLKEDGVDITDIGLAMWIGSNKDSIAINSSYLSYDKTYTLSIGKSLEDIAGLDFEGISVEFTTLSNARPDVDSVSPEDGETAVAKAADVKYIFDRDIEIADVTKVSIYMDPDGAATEVTDDSKTKVVDGNTLVVGHADFVASEVTYEVVLEAGAVQSKNTTFTNTVSGSHRFVSWDNVKPTVDESLPTVGGTMAADAGYIGLKFDEKVIVGTGTAVIRNAATDAVVQTLTEADLSVWEQSDSAIVFKLKGDLDFSTGYYVEITDGLITDDEGNTYVGITGNTWNFTTDEDVPFTVKSTVPALLEDQVSLTDNFVITFTQPVLAGSASSSKTVALYVFDPVTSNMVEVFNDAANQSNFVYSGNTLTIDPVDPLVADRRYVLLIYDGIVKDIYNRSLITNNPTAIEFYTGDIYGPQYTSVPADGDENVAVDADIVITWDETPINPTTGNAYTAAEIKDNYIVNISGTFADNTTNVANNYEVTIAGLVWTINLDDSLAGERPYNVLVNGSVIEDENGNLSTSKPSFVPQFTFFTEDNLTVNPSITVKNITGVSAELEISAHDPEGCTAYYIVKESSATAPTAAELIAGGGVVAFDGSYSETVDISNLTSAVEYIAYVVSVDSSSNANQSDIVTDTFTTLDIIAPVATIVSPANGAVGVDADADLVLSFDEAVLPNPSAQIFIRDVATEVVAERIDFGSATITSEDGKKLKYTIERNVTLKSNTEYYVEVPKGAFVDTTAGNPMAAIEKGDWTFTVKDTDAPYVVADGYTPVLANTPEMAKTATISLKFNELVQAGTGAITVYYSDNNDEFEVINVADLTFGTDSTVSFSLDNTPVEGEEFYIVVPNTVIKDMSDNAFAGIGSTDNWDFEVLDETAPYVSATYPEDGDKGIAIDTWIGVKFSEDVYNAADGSAFDNTTIDDIVTIKDADGNEVEFDATFHSGDSMRIILDSLLASQTTYTVTVSPVVDAKKIASTETSFSFTTKDMTPATVIFDPVAESVDVDENGVVTVTFSEPIFDDIVTTEEGKTVYVSLIPANIPDHFTYTVSNDDGTVDGAAVEFTGAINNANTVITLTPKKDLTSETWYKVTMLSETHANVVDSANNMSLSDSTFFKVADGVGPVAVAYSPEDGTSEDAAMVVKFNELVALGSGSFFIRDYEDGTVVEEVVVSASTVTVGSDSTVTIAHADFPGNMDFYVSVDEGAIVDTSGNAWEGIETEDIEEWAFSTADGVKPQIQALSPDSGAVNVGLEEALEVTFDKEIALGSGSVVIYNEDWTIFQQIAVSASTVTLKALTDPSYLVNRIASISHKAFEENTKYYVRIEKGAFVDKAGNKFDGLLDMSWTFTTEDGAAPGIVWEEVYPLQNATDVPAGNIDIKIAFDRNVLAGATGNVYIYEEIGLQGFLVETIDPNDAAKVQVDGDVVTVTPDTMLQEYKNYYIIIDNGAFTNTATNKEPFAGIITTQKWKFTTGEFAIPELTGFEPKDTIYNNYPDFVMTFENDVVLSSAGGTLVVSEEGASSALLTITLTSDMIDGSVVTVSNYDTTGTGGLKFDTTYVVNVTAGAFESETGMAWEGITDDTTWTFTPVLFTDIDDPFAEETVEFTAYPNPFDTEINIDNSDKLTRVIVTNIAGQRVLDIEYPDSVIRTGNLVSGVYVISMFTEDGLVKTETMIKR